MNENKHLTPVFIIYMDGARLDTGHEGALQSITINDRLNGISSFTILSGGPPEKILAAGIIKMKAKSPSTWVTKMTWGSFLREVTGLRDLLPQIGAEQLEVSGSNVLHKLNHGSCFLCFGK